MSFGVPRSAEFDRIIKLPRRLLKLDEVEDLTPAFLRPDSQCSIQECPIKQLLPIQSAALWEAERASGLFGAIGVGGGKTLLSLLLPAAFGSKVSVVLVPPILKAKALADKEHLGLHFCISDPHIVSYSELSSVRGSDVLQRIRPDLIVADEAHALKHRSATRTKRFLRYMRENPGTRFCALSGTMTDKSLLDYAHLIELALRKGSPLPIGYMELLDWSEALDPSDCPRPPGVLLRLCGEDQKPSDSATDLQTAAREAFHRRLVETTGVIVTGEGSCRASIIIRGRFPTLPASVRNALALLRRTWAIGDEEFSDAPSLYRAARQLALGFYYRWDWPGGVKDEEWLRARSIWHRAVRGVLSHRARDGLDSPFLVAQAASRGDLRPDERAAWEGWDSVRSRPQPPTVPVWLDRFAVEDAATWGLEKPGLIWCEQGAFGQAVANKLGAPWHGGGTGDSLRQEDGSRTVVLSVRAHSEGHDHLKSMDRALFTCPPVSGKTWQQAIGRQHRPGQVADEILIDVYQHSPELREAFTDALENARYVQSSTGQAQKLLQSSLVEVG